MAGSMPTSIQIPRYLDTTADSVQGDRGRAFLETAFGEFEMSVDNSPRAPSSDANVKLFEYGSVDRCLFEPG